MEVLAGLLLLINRFVPLALALLAPILVGILTFHITINISGIVPGAILTLLELYLAWVYRKAFAPMLCARMHSVGRTFVFQIISSVLRNSVAVRSEDFWLPGEAQRVVPVPKDHPRQWGCT